jgi:hypothetical protein
MKNNFFTGLILGIVAMILVGFVAAQNKTIFQPAAPAVVSARMCNTQLEIIAALKFYADREYLVDIHQLGSGTVIVVGKKY